jgi:uncharacterized delta-60 repeat protein
MTVVLFTLVASPAWAAVDGSLDATFDTDGMLRTDIGGALDQAQGVAIQSNGKIVAAGYAYTGSYNDFAVVRYNTDGSLDTTFGTGGKVTTPIGVTDDQAEAVAIQSNGKIVVAGSSLNGSDYDFAVVRYNTDGSLDTTFDGDGKLTTDFGASGEQAFAVAIQSNGKIVAAGGTLPGSDYDFALARYNTDGSLDTTFDGDGKLATDFSGAYDYAWAVAIQSNGRIVAAGSSTVGTDQNFALARYNTNGSLDGTFDGDGKLTTDFGSLEEVAYGVAIQADGRIVAAGRSGNGFSGDFALARYYTNGSLDTTFDTDGKVTTPFSGEDQARAVAIQPNGKIVTAGLTDSGAGADFALARYYTNGSLDISFDGDGKVITPIAIYDAAYAVAIQSDGKIVAAGGSADVDQYDFALARYNSAAPYRPDAQIRGGLASSYIGRNIYNLGGGGQTFGRRVRPGFSDQFNVRMQNDGNTIDSFFVHGEGSSTKFRITYFSGSINVTGAVVAGTFQTFDVNPGFSRELKVVIFVRPGVNLGSTMTDLISVTSNGNPAVRDVVGAKVLVSRNAGDFNSQLPIP